MKSNTLDAVRGTAALCVAIGHGGQIWISPWTGADSLICVISGQLSTWSVAVFFVLSGLVIASSAKQRCSSGVFDFSGFMQARLLRIFPPLFAAIALMVLLVSIIKLFGLYGSEGYRLPADLSIARDMARYEWPALLPSLSLSFGIGYGNPMIGFNGPLWTLGYEFWLYVLAAFAVWTVRGEPWAALGCVIIVLAIMLGYDHIRELWPLFALTWGAGFAVGWRQPPRRVLLVALAVSSVGMALILYGAGGFTNPYATWAGKAFYLLAAVVMVALLVLMPKHVPALPVRVMAWTSRFSYTLYLIHFPVLMFGMSVLRPSLYQFGLAGHLAGGIFCIGCAMALAHVMAMAVENRPLIRRAIQSLVDGYAGNGQWQQWFAFQEVATETGPVRLKPVWRRRLPRGGYEYRAMSPAEEADYVSREAW